jgi:hypothetical protein
MKQVGYVMIFQGAFFIVRYAAHFISMADEGESQSEVIERWWFSLSLQEWYRVVLTLRLSTFLMTFGGWLAFVVNR